MGLIVLVSFCSRKKDERKALKNGQKCLHLSENCRVRFEAENDIFQGLFFHPAEAVERGGVPRSHPEDTIQILEKNLLTATVIRDWAYGSL